MKNKTLGFFGIATYILSVASSATDLAGNPVMPAALILISGVGTIVFIVMAVIRLWTKAPVIAIALATSTIILSISSFVQVLVPSFESTTIILLNVVKVVSLVASIVAVVKLFRMSDMDILDQRIMAEKLYKENPGLALLIATGEEQAPSGILPEAVYAKVCDEAEKSENMDTIMRVGNSHRNTKISAEAQRLKFRDPDSAIEKIKEVVNSRREAFERTLPKGKTYEMALEEEVNNIKRTISESSRD